MRPLRYSINVTLDGCCDHRAMIADEELHRHAVENLDQADALLFGRVTYEMMKAALRPLRGLAALDRLRRSPVLTRRTRQIPPFRFSSGRLRPPALDAAVSHAAAGENPVHASSCSKTTDDVLANGRSRGP